MVSACKQDEACQPETIQERFERFHFKHPEVYELFKGFANELRNAGCRRFGAKAIFERIRWHYAVTGRGDQIKLNNVYTAYYARQLTQDDPSFLGFFEFRKLVSRWED